MAKMLLSFVIPCYRSQNTIGKVVAELTETLQNRGDEFDHEIILVNDGSPDDTALAIKELTKAYPSIVFVDLSRNFGQHSAVMAGFHQVRGDIVICLDDDGQTPASECFRLIDKVIEGYDIVFAKYPTRKQSTFRNLGSRFNTLCNQFFFNQPKNLTPNSYYACLRFVVDSALTYPNPFPFVTGLLFQSAGRYCNVDITHNQRLDGDSGYTLSKLIKLWLNGVTAFSIKPLRLANYMGWIIAMVGFCSALITIIRKLLMPSMEAGWASTISVMLLLGGVIIALIGIVGEYIGRIYLSINRQPQYVVRSITRGSDSQNQEIKAQEVSPLENHSCDLGA